MKKVGNTFQGTVLVYTLILVVLGVFMASSVLNIAVELSNQYDLNKLESSLKNTIKTKGNLSMKYARQLNTTGSGFVDVLSCPQNISMSGSAVSGTIDTELRVIADIPRCQSTSMYNGENVDVYFNAEYSDFEFAELEGQQIVIHSGSLAGTFSDSDATFMDLGTAAYFAPDGIDDNLDSDNYSPYSTGALAYPDGYTDNDDDAKRMAYGYIIEDSGLYNVLWSNTQYSDYIAGNINNQNSDAINIGEITNGHIYLDIDTDFKAVLYEINKSQYDATKELISSPGIFGAGQIAGIGYLQNDMSLSSSVTPDTYSFNFRDNDYALFIENTSSGSLLYKIRAFQAATGSGIYLNPLDDSDPAIFGYLGSHVYVDEEGRLTADQMEIFGLK